MPAPRRMPGPAGVVVVIVRDDMLERTPANLPVMLDYKALAASGSLHNTPPALPSTWWDWSSNGPRNWADWLPLKRPTAPKQIWSTRPLTRSGGFYRGHAKPEARSMMNIPFRLPSEELEDTFAKEAKKQRSDRSQRPSLGRRYARFHLQCHDR